MLFHVKNKNQEIISVLTFTGGNGKAIMCQMSHITHLNAFAHAQLQTFSVHCNFLDNTLNKSAWNLEPNVKCDHAHIKLII